MCRRASTDKFGTLDAQQRELNQPHSSRPNCIPELRPAEQNPGFATILAGKPSLSGKHPPVRQLLPAGALTVAFGPATPPTRSAPEQPSCRVHRRPNGGVGSSESEYEISKSEVNGAYRYMHEALQNHGVQRADPIRPTTESQLHHRKRTGPETAKSLRTTGFEALAPSRSKEVWLRRTLKIPPSWSAIKKSIVEPGGRHQYRVRSTQRRGGRAANRRDALLICDKFCALSVNRHPTANEPILSKDAANWEIQNIERARGGTASNLRRTSAYQKIRPNFEWRHLKTGAEITG
jgi:hypothetical protein